MRSGVQEQEPGPRRAAHHRLNALPVEPARRPNRFRVGLRAGEGGDMGVDEAAEPMRNAGHDARKTRALRSEDNRCVRGAAKSFAGRRVACIARLREGFAGDRKCCARQPWIRAPGPRRRFRWRAAAPSRAASSLPAVTASSEALLSAEPVSSAWVNTRIDSITPLRSTRPARAQSPLRSCSSLRGSSRCCLGRLTET